MGPGIIGIQSAWILPYVRTNNLNTIWWNSKGQVMLEATGMLCKADQQNFYKYLLV